MLGIEHIPLQLDAAELILNLAARLRGHTHRQRDPHRQRDCRFAAAAPPGCVPSRTGCQAQAAARHAPDAQQRHAQPVFARCQLGFKGIFGLFLAFHHPGRAQAAVEDHGPVQRHDDRRSDARAQLPLPQTGPIRRDQGRQQGGVEVVLGVIPAPGEELLRAAHQLPGGGLAAEGVFAALVRLAAGQKSARLAPRFLPLTPNRPARPAARTGSAPAPRPRYFHTTAPAPARA